MNSRLISHRNEANPSLFHTTYGITNPITLQLSLTEFNPSDEAAARAAMGALLHERQHWLQTIGTSAGLFHYLILDQQAHLVQAILAREKQLAPSDLPLISGQFAQAGELFAWERIECIRRIFWGARRGDIRILEEVQNPLRFTAMTELLKDLFITAVNGSHDAISYFDSVWPKAGNRIGSPPKLLDDRMGWGLGARHIMEDAARVTEVFHLAQYGQPIPIQDYFTGVYGKARTLFYQVMGYNPLFQGISPISEIVFSYVCDVALNRLYPPIGPADGSAIDDVWNPATYLAYLTRRLADFDLRRSLDVYDPMQVRQLILELDSHLDRNLGGDLSQLRILTRHAVDAIFRDLDHEVLSGQLFEVDSTGWPRAASWHGRLTYMLALAKAAFSLRETYPEIFVFPVCHYVTSRERFHQLYDPIASPLIRYGAKGIAPSPGKPEGWLEYFLCDALMYDLLRRMVMYGPDELVTTIAPYTQIYPGHQFGQPLVEAILRLFFGTRPVGKYITDTLKASWSTVHP